MNNPILSTHFENRMPSSIRLGQIRFGQRKNKPDLVNVAIGNVSLPMNPAMQKRMFALQDESSPFAKGVVRYSGTAGTEEAQQAFKRILDYQGFPTDKLHVAVTDGGSSAMEVVLLGVCGPAGTDEKPLMMIDPAYTNYISFAHRIGRKTVTIKRSLAEDGAFSLPSIPEIEEAIQKHQPGALVVIPFDNPTGQLYDFEMLKQLAGLCVKYNMWLIGDEAYRELYYVKDQSLTSIWKLTDQDVPGIEGRRIGIETASKVWNACGLRIGALVTDNADFYEKAVAEYTANLCSNTIGQYIFAALAQESNQSLAKWTQGLREYYQGLMFEFTDAIKKKMPKLIVSRPDAAIYSVLDVRNIVKPGFDAVDFVLYCAEEGAMDYNGKPTTLLVAPLKGFYDIPADQENPGKTQFRVAFIETPENLKKVPDLFAGLLEQYEKQRS